MLGSRGRVVETSSSLSPPLTVMSGYINTIKMHDFFMKTRMAIERSHVLHYLINAL